MAKTAKDAIVAQGGGLVRKEEPPAQEGFALWRLDMYEWKWFIATTNNTIEGIRQAAKNTGEGTPWFISEVTPPPIASFKT